MALGDSCGLCAAHPDYAYAIGFWHDCYDDMILGEIAGIAGILGVLHEAGVRLVVLPNLPADVVGVLRRFEWMSLFDAVIVSGE
jgi:hypothetical protein